MKDDEYCCLSLDCLQALEIADTLVSSGHISVLVLDSVAALVPRSELEGEMGDAQVGVQARLMSHVPSPLHTSQILYFCLLNSSLRVGTSS